MKVSTLTLQNLEDLAAMMHMALYYTAQAPHDTDKHPEWVRWVRLDKRIRSEICQRKHGYSYYTENETPNP